MSDTPLNEEALEVAARAANEEGWTCFEGSGEPGNYDDCDDCQRVDKEHAEAIITAYVRALPAPAVVETVEVVGREVDQAMIRRVEAAIESAAARRSLIVLDLPECHRKNCGERHGDIDNAFHEMKTAIISSVRSELVAEVVTRPDVSEHGDTPEQDAVNTLATLLHTYRPEKTSTYIKAAQLMVDAYPTLIEAFKEQS